MSTIKPFSQIAIGFASAFAAGAMADGGAKLSKIQAYNGYPGPRRTNTVDPSNSMVCNREGVKAGCVFLALAGGATALPKHPMLAGIYFGAAAAL